MLDLPHGQRWVYQQHHCRCEPCTQADRAYNTKRRRLIAYGQWEHLTDSTPTADRINHWRAQGITVQTISAATGLNHGTIEAIQPGKQIRPIIERVILNANPQPTPNGFTNPTGTLRRIQALYAIGWNAAAIAEAAGWTSNQILRLLTPAQQGKAIRRQTRDRIAVAYDKLWDQTPPAGRERTKALRRAGREGWALPMEWDDDTIDDSRHVPRTLARRTRLTVDEELVARVWRLRAQGWTDQAIADEVGYRTASAVCKLRQRHPNPQED